MGKRKSTKAPPPKKKRPKVETKFSCPACNHDKSISVKLKTDVMQGELSCSECRVSFTSTITKLSEPIDVYAKWLAAWERVNAAQEAEAEEGAEGGEPEPEG